MTQTLTDTLFPTLSAKTLAGTEITYPDDIKGKVSLILIAFERNTQRVLDSWINPFQKEFQTESGVQFFEIPMLKRRWIIMSPIIDGGMRSGIPEEKHGNVTTFYGDIDKYCEKLLIEDKSDGYVFLLDKTGRIQWYNRGLATPEKLTLLFQKIRSLM